jgi:capsular polysaccharide biosynthesis protein
LLRALRNELLQSIEPPPRAPKRVYISRRLAARGRRVANEEELTALLERYGFGCYAMESLSLREQLALMMQAEVLIGPHGAGILHCLFMPEHSTVIELYAEGFEEKTNRAALELLRHRHLSFVAQDVRGDPYAGEFVVDLSKLEAMLQSEV